MQEEEEAGERAAIRRRERTGEAAEAGVEDALEAPRGNPAEE